MRTLCIVLVLGMLAGGFAGCVNVQAPEKVEVGGKGEAQSWESYGRSYADQYRARQPQDNGD